MNNKLTFILALGVLTLVVLACNFSATTANLSDLKLATDQSASDPKTSFERGDTIYAVTALNNASGKHKAKFRLLFDDVEGAQKGTVAYKIEKDLEIDGSRNFWFTFSVPGNGFVPGKYIVEAVLTDENGEKQIDKKTAGFTVKGDNKPTAPKKDSDSDVPADVSDDDSSDTN